MTKTIGIAGASGFIGHNLIDSILSQTDHRVVALSRSERNSSNPRLFWKQCDLFSVLDIEKALSGCDHLIYLVHSMQPSAHLDQASFDDYDLILADNFGRAAKKLSIHKVVYLGGLLPTSGKLSRHLISRLEVENVLQYYLPHYTILRAGLILGPQGSSFQMLFKLVRRLPVLICPRWTKNQTSPVYVDDVIASIVKVIEEDHHEKKIYDLGSNDNKSYIEILKLTANAMKQRKLFISLPFSVLFISRFWISLFSGASKHLVYPLVESLQHSLCPRSKNLLKDAPNHSVSWAIEQTVTQSLKMPYHFHTRKVKRNTVRSVQRLILPKTSTAEKIAREYMHWLPSFFSPLLKVYLDGSWVYFCFLKRNYKLLILQWSPERSTVDRQLFYIKGGLLASKQDRGRLEFREVPEKKCLLAAIHDFYPALPWYVYRYTQAIVHLIVMFFFSRHLKLIERGQRKWIQKYSS